MKSGGRLITPVPRLIAETEGDAFYKGRNRGEGSTALLNKRAAFLQYEDLASFEPEWVTPLSVRYHGWDVWELPPNGQGLVALVALLILDAWEFPTKEDVEDIPPAN